MQSSRVLSCAKKSCWRTHMYSWIAGLTAPVAAVTKLCYSSTPSISVASSIDSKLRTIS